MTTLEETIAKNERLLSDVDSAVAAGERALREAGVDRDAASFIENSAVPAEVRDMVQSEHAGFLAGLDKQVKSGRTTSKPKRPTMKRMI